MKIGAFLLLFFSLHLVGCASSNKKDDRKMEPPPVSGYSDKSETRKPADVYGTQSIGDTRITMGPAGTVIQGPNGMMIVTNNQDAIRGTWTKGIELSIGQVLSGATIPDKIIVNNFDQKMADGNMVMKYQF
jgi:hypothetical protein